MRQETFFQVLGELDDDLIKAAKAPGRKRRSWKLWGAMAACLCLAAGLLSLSHWQSDPQDSRGTTEQVYTLPQAERLSVELVEWGGDHFKAVVVDAGDNHIFPADAQLSVVFDYDTEIRLDDGTLMVFDPDQPDTEVIGWEAGTVVLVEFSRYIEYREGDYFYNQLFAGHVEAESE